MSSSSCLIVCSLLFVSENVHNISSLREHLQCWGRRGRLVKNSISATHNSPYTHTLFIRLKNSFSKLFVRALTYMARFLKQGRRVSEVAGLALGPDSFQRHHISLLPWKKPRRLWQCNNDGFPGSHNWGLPALSSSSSSLHDAHDSDHRLISRNLFSLTT